MTQPSTTSWSSPDSNEQLIDLWPNMTFRTTEGPPRTILVISSLSLEVPPSLAPLVTAYEERYLCLVLLLAKAQKTRVVYVTSQPMLPRLVDYYLQLIPGLDRDELRERLAVVSHQRQLLSPTDAEDSRTPKGHSAAAQPARGERSGHHAPFRHQ